jgi:hypothetical protein
MDIGEPLRTVELPEEKPAEPEEPVRQPEPEADPERVPA